MAEIINRASLRYTYGKCMVAQVLSNVASVMLNGALIGSKTSLGSTYRSGVDITYIITIQNISSVSKTAVQVSDNLGTYLVSGTTTATPLTYVGPTELFVNGTPSGELTPNVTASNIVFTIPTIPAGGNVVLVYKVSVNEYAPLETGSTITNTASYIGDDGCNDFSVDNTVTVDDYADVRIFKTMSPNPIVCGSPITYTFTLYNYGNIEATNVTLTDTFSPYPATITVKLNGATAGTDTYTYIDGMFTFGTRTTPLTLPPATFETAADGSVTVTPSVTIITVTGIISNS